MAIPNNVKLTSFSLFVEIEGEEIEGNLSIVERTIGNITKYYTSKISKLPGSKFDKEKLERLFSVEKGSKRNVFDTKDCFLFLMFLHLLEFSSEKNNKTLLMSPTYFIIGKNIVGSFIRRMREFRKKVLGGHSKKKWTSHEKARIGDVELILTTFFNKIEKNFNDDLCLNQLELFTDGIFSKKEDSVFYGAVKLSELVYFGVSNNKDFLFENIKSLSNINTLLELSVIKLKSVEEFQTSLLNYKLDNEKFNLLCASGLNVIEDKDFSWVKEILSKIKQSVSDEFEISFNPKERRTREKDKKNIPKLKIRIENLKISEPETKDQQSSEIEIGSIISYDLRTQGDVCPKQLEALIEKLKKEFN